MDKELLKAALAQLFTLAKAKEVKHPLVQMALTMAEAALDTVVDQYVTTQESNINAPGS